MDQAATDGAAIPDLHMANVARRLLQKRPAFGDDFRSLQSALARHRSDA